MLIAQISDAHIRPEGVLLQGVVDPALALRAAVAAVNALRVDAVVFTGDLTEEGLAAEYDRARDILAGLDAPLFALAGNHDDAGRFAGAIGPLNWVQKVGPLRLVGFDVTVPGAHHGAVDAARLGWLAEALAEDRPTLVFQHQPPFETGIAALDAYRCFGEAGLAAVIAGAPQVQGLFCGHVHRFMQRRFGGTVAVTAPSLSPAIALRLEPGAAGASRAEPPALLLHHWRGGGLTTHLQPLGDFAGPWEFF